MCDNITLIDGRNIWSVGEFRDLGFDVDESISDNSCLCSIELKDFLPHHQYRSNGFEWLQIDANGKTYEERLIVMKKKKPSTWYATPENVENKEKWIKITRIVRKNP